MMFRKICILLILALGANIAQADPETVQKYRESVMKAIGGHMGAMVNGLKGPVLPEYLGLHAKAMTDLAEMAPHIFPEGSGGAKTEALPAIWEKPDDFKNRMVDFVSAARAMDSAVAGSEMSAIGMALKDLGKTCKACHDDFKKKD